VCARRPGSGGVSSRDITKNYVQEPAAGPGKPSVDLRLKHYGAPLPRLARRSSYATAVRKIAKPNGEFAESSSMTERVENVTRLLKFDVSPSAKPEMVGWGEEGHPPAAIGHRAEGDAPVRMGP
jgi:hypothetical protein